MEISAVEVMNSIGCLSWFGTGFTASSVGTFSSLIRKWELTLWFLWFELASAPATIWMF